MVASACAPDIGCDPNALVPFQIIPIEYQGWVFLIFLGVSALALLYGFYIIATTPIENTSIDTMEPKKRKFYDKIFFEFVMLLMLGLLGSFIMTRMGI